LTTIGSRFGHAETLTRLQAAIRANGMQVWDASIRQPVRTRAALGDAAFDQAWRDGSAMELDEAVRYALGGRTGRDGRAQ